MIVGPADGQRLLVKTRGKIPGIEIGIGKIKGQPSAIWDRSRLPSCAPQLRGNGANSGGA